VVGVFISEGAQTVIDEEISTYYRHRSIFYQSGGGVFSLEGRELRPDVFEKRFDDFLVVAHLPEIAEGTVKISKRFRARKTTVITCRSRKEELHLFGVKSFRERTILIARSIYESVVTSEVVFVPAEEERRPEIKEARSIVNYILRKSYF